MRESWRSGGGRLPGGDRRRAAARVLSEPSCGGDDGVVGAGLDAWLWGDWHSDELGDKSVARPAEMAVIEQL